MANISKNAVETIKQLNEELFEAEYKLEQQRRAVSKYRYYLAADPTADSVMDLHGAMANLRACQQHADSLHKALEKAMENI